jgi:hypothetical protein
MHVDVGVWLTQSSVGFAGRLWEERSASCLAFVAAASALLAVAVLVLGGSAPPLPERVTWLLLMPPKHRRVVRV